MARIQLKSLPAIAFAHKFGASEYHGCIPAKENNIEITVITEGELCAEQNGRRYIAQQGDILCNFYHDQMHVSSHGYHCHHTVCFTAVLDRTGDATPESFDIPTLIHPPDGFTVCLRLVDEIIKTHMLYPENSLKMSGLFLQLLGELDRMDDRSHPSCSPGEHHYVKRAKKYIYEHISEPIMQKDIAAHLGITPEHLCTVFKKSEGRSVIRFINEMKLAHIRTLMESKQLSLNQAALQYGFTDPNYVSKLYKRYYHETITQAVKLLK